MSSVTCEEAHSNWHCLILFSEEAPTVPAEVESLDPAGSPPSTESFPPAKVGPSQGEVAAVQPVMGISQRIRTGPKQKKDLGTLGTLPLSYSENIYDVGRTHCLKFTILF